MKAIEILTELKKSSYNLSKDYQDEADYLIFKGKEKEAQMKLSLSNDFSKKSQSYQEAIDEINELILSKNNL